MIERPQRRVGGTLSRSHASCGRASADDHSNARNRVSRKAWRGRGLAESRPIVPAAIEGGTMPKSGEKDIIRWTRRENESYLYIQLRTLMKVGPARCICATRNPYHHIAPHRSPRLFFGGLPTKSIGDVITTGMKSIMRRRKRAPVRNGSHMVSRRKWRMRRKIGLWCSLGDDIW
jgi:hypothetical protein